MMYFSYGTRIKLIDNLFISFKMTMSFFLKEIIIRKKILTKLNFIFLFFIKSRVIKIAPHDE